MDPLTTILTVPAVLAIVELAKRLGLVAKWALLLAVVAAVALNVAAYLWSSSGLFAAIVAGLLTGLAAAGVYDAAKAAAPKT
jgi:flagellar biosynthesis/type III secretory pathway M-ring protein FliF/YscJ